MFCVCWVILRGILYSPKTVLDLNDDSEDGQERNFLTLLKA